MTLRSRTSAKWFATWESTRIVLGASTATSPPLALRHSLGTLPTYRQQRTLRTLPHAKSKSSTQSSQGRRLSTRRGALPLQSRSTEEPPGLKERGENSLRLHRRIARN